MEDVVVKKEDNSGTMSSAMRLVFEDDNFIDTINNECISSDNARLRDNATCKDLLKNTVASCTTVTEHVTETQNIIKCEIFKCTLCFEDFTQEIEYNLHMIIHHQNGDSNAAYDEYQVCESQSAVGCSLDSPVVKNETGFQRLNDDFPSVTLAPDLVAPLSMRVSENNEYKVEPTEVADKTSEQIIESNSDTKTYTDISRYTNCVVLLYDIFKELEKTSCSGANRDSCDLTASDAPLTRLAQNNEYGVEATKVTGPIQKSEQILESNITTKTYTDVSSYTNCVVRLYDILKHPKKTAPDDNSRVSARSGAKRYSCELCHYKATYKCKIIQHKITHSDAKPFSCDLCQFKCARKPSLALHMRTHISGKPYSCDICNHKTSQKRFLLRHMRTHSGEKPYSCDLCHYKAAEKRTLIFHIRTHTGEKPYPCELCNKKFSIRRNFLQHMRVHRGEKSNFCKICDFKCADRSALVRHIRTHTGEKPYSCELCNRKFVQKGALVVHMKTHSGEKLYQCELCKYKGATKMNLTRHWKRVHCDERPYSCDVCNFKCVDKGDLVRHTRIHTGEKPYSCDVCHYKSSRKQRLINHKRRHTGEKPFICEICNHKCAQKSYLLRHMKSHTMG
ncbi:zinc finger protein 25 isoform X2 [Bicyclus anynana]|uniref:Zinc finger protein 25 isoform X2 n=1 Tax=Bicyclus anynana TaxID=110368 RepID=A0ABM3LLZ9_BICAN|nr:zinc finger protein 25 isoform X2 [Bicyclus anynana]